MKLKEFEGRPNRWHSEVPRVTLNQRGVITINRHCDRAFGSPSAVKLFYDANEKIIALQPADPRRTNSFPVRRKEGKFHMRTIHAMPFCKHFDIRVPRTVLFNEIDINDDGIMILPLGNTTAVGNRW